MLAVASLKSAVLLKRFAAITTSNEPSSSPWEAGVDLVSNGLKASF